MSRDYYYSELGVPVEEIQSSLGDGAADLESLSICSTWDSAVVRPFKWRMCHGCVLYRQGAVNDIVNFFASKDNKVVDEVETTM